MYQALMDDEIDLHEYFREDDDSDVGSEYSLLSKEEDPFTPAAANYLLFTLAKQNEQQVNLQREAAKLLAKGGLPKETSEEVFKQALGFKKKFTAISEELYEQCNSDTEFHLILCLGYRLLEEARAWRMRDQLKPKKGGFNEINIRTFKDLAHQFNLAPTTVNRNYNEAIEYHKLRKLKTSKKTGKKSDKEKNLEETGASETSEKLSGDGSEKDTPLDIEAGEAAEALPKILLVLKQELSEQELPLEGEMQ